MPSPIRIGVLLIQPLQLLDLSPIDLFGMLASSYLEACEFPAPTIALALPIQIHYISKSGRGSLAELTAQARLAVTAGLDSAEVTPGNLDILLVPGPDPRVVPAEEELEFVRRHVGKGVTLMTVCTGIQVAAYSGVLDGKKATGPRPMVDMVLKKKFPNVKWEDKRWSIDGNIWTSAGITNGQEMVATYIKKRWPGPLADTVVGMSDIVVRSQDYDTSKVGETAWWIWTFTRAFIRSPFAIFKKK